MLQRSIALLACMLAATTVACSLPETDVGDSSGGSTTDPGALVDVSMHSTVGVLLDELPESMRQRVADAYVAKPAAFWQERAKRQTEATLYRLIYRNYVYEGKGQLPLPPRDLWDITLSATPARTTIGGHDMVAVEFDLATTLLTDIDSPEAADPALGEIDGTWDEPFELPIDPELLLQRTGLACLDEVDFPPNSVDSENALRFFDQDCEGGEHFCHVSEPYPAETCVEALDAHVGRVSTSLHFRRAAWDATRANLVRTNVPSTGADLEVVVEGLEGHRLIYRYIEPSSCAVAEACVSGTGWRRLLQFDAEVRNIGQSPVHIGDVSETSPAVEHNMVEYSACHGHQHFSHYGRFAWSADGEELGSKRAFCLLSTSRTSNNEQSPLTHEYNCQYQGISPGWGDDYFAGLECQWIDVTPTDTSTCEVTGPLTFEVNPDGFLCEGTPVVDEDGLPVFESTTFTGENGNPVDRALCDSTPGADDNNVQSTDVTLPMDGGTYVTEDCAHDVEGPLRNCGFRAQGDTHTCTPGEDVHMVCATLGLKPQVLRICEASGALMANIACTEADALANATVQGIADVTFTCPGPRDSSELGGLYSYITAPVFSEDPHRAVLCLKVE